MALRYARNQHYWLTSTLCLSEPALPSAVPGDFGRGPHIRRLSRGEGPEENERDEWLEYFHD
jgi:hypothetical protein